MPSFSRLIVKAQSPRPWALEESHGALEALQCSTGKEAHLAAR